MSAPQGPVACADGVVVMKLPTFNSREWWQFWLLVWVLGVAFAWNNSLTVSADLSRNGVPFQAWHPYAWEFSSLFGFWLLYFAVYAWFRRVPLWHANWRRHLLWHFLASVLFSVGHVLLMVALRQAIYWVLGDSYDFGSWGSELWYEYRKDVVTYFVFVLILTAYGYYLDKHRRQSAAVQRIQVKNKHGVFWLEPDEVLTIESGGNYVYFHTHDRVLSNRDTMAQVEQSLDPERFLRVHRSFIVNLSHIQTMQKNAKDSTELCLPNGKVVPVSKKYRADLLAALSPQG